MADYRRLGGGISLIVAIFLVVQLGALALVEPFVQGGLQPVEDPNDPTNSVVYVAVILLVTAVMLLAFKYGVDAFVRVAIVAAGAWLAHYVFWAIVPPIQPVAGYNLPAIGLAAILGIVLYVHPEWYVLDTAGAIMGAAAAGLFGITFDIFPAILLLTVLAIYDAISVYRTEHMLTLASGVMDLKVPVVLVIPMKRGYSFLDAEFPDPAAEGDGDETSGALDPVSGEGETARVDEAEDTDGADVEDPNGADGADPNGADVGDGNGLDRDALFIGLGDAVIPSVMVASAAYFTPEWVPTVASIPLPAVTAMGGTFVGLFVLLWMVLEGRAHAGLPLLNGGAIAGYLGGALVGGMSLVAALGF